MFMFRAVPRSIVLSCSCLRSYSTTSCSDPAGVQPKLYRHSIESRTYAPRHCSTASVPHENQGKNGIGGIFYGSQSQDVRLFTKMIVSHLRKDRLDDALKLFYKMPVKDTVSWNTMIKGCLDCGDFGTAEKLFDEMPQRTVVSWTTMIHGFFQIGLVDQAERFFQEMPNRDLASWNAMLHGYCNNSRIEDSLKMFERMPLRNVVSWTSLIHGLDQNGKSEEALVLFARMFDSNEAPNSSSLTCALRACANALNFPLGMQIHGIAVKLGLCFNEFVCASLITCYANCNQIDKAIQVFNESSHRNVVMWTALLTGFGLNCRHGDGLKVFSDMLRTNVFPNQSTFVSALNSSSCLEALDWGKAVHAPAVKLKLADDIFVGNSLIVMYNKCGVLDDAVVLFKNLGERNIVTWNAIIGGCAQHGRGRWAMMLFNQMIRGGVEPDEITLTGLLSACDHSGLLQKGQCLFRYFSKKAGVELNPEHYALMVDILGRWGKLEEAEDLIRKMPIKANSVVWLALLSSCRMHFNIDLAERAARCILDLEPQCSAAYILLSNLYASINRWVDVSRLRVTMKQRGIVKQRGSSWVTLKGHKHSFLSGDKSHPLTEKIYQKLGWLKFKLKGLGHIPDKRFALHDVEDEQKEESLFYHSERLAIAFALISTVEGSTVTVMKNLRICGDCHSAIKLIAKIVGREIIVRDSSRFHHFWNGDCSCGDYW